MSKVFSLFTVRDFPVLFIESYNDMIIKLESDIGYKTFPLFRFDSDKLVVEDYFNSDELKEEFRRMKEFLQDEKNLKNMIDNFNNNFNKLEPYFDGRLVESVEELKDLYDVFVNYFVGFAYTWVIPDLEGVSEKLKKECFKLREMTESYSSKRDKLFVSLLAHLYPKLKDKVRFMNKEEAFSNLPEKELSEILDKRSKGFIYYNKEIVLERDINDYLHEKNIRLEKPTNPDINSKSFTGASACKGKAIGRARVVYNENDLRKIKTNEDILVTPMTRPDYVRFMKKAGAIVTDEGGIICHAAIVAREMKKPCIIGTKVATNVLNDGDLIEVDADADKGIVKILEKAE